MLIAAIIFAGVVSLGLQGNYVYFGTIDIGPRLPDLLVAAVLLVGMLAGVAGGIWPPSRKTPLRPS